MLLLSAMVIGSFEACFGCMDAWLHDFGHVGGVDLARSGGGVSQSFSNSQ
jgi:hypothetical protein